MTQRKKILINSARSPIIKSFIKTAALGALTLGFLAFSLPMNALTTQVNYQKTITTQTIFNPQSESEQKLSQEEEVSETLIAGSCGYYERRGVIFYCCIDSFGNWACDPV